MKLTNEFVVESPLDQVWSLFDQLERVVPCMPGAAYLGGEAGEHRVSMKVKIGAVVSNFQGTVGFVEKDEAAHRVVMRGAAKDTGGKGAAAALIETRLAAVTPRQTRVEVTTDLNMSGRLAQFGGPIVADIAQRLVQQFTANLHQVLAREAQEAGVSAALAAAQPPGAGPEASAPPAAPAEARSTAEVQPLDLGAVVGASLRHRYGRYLLPFAVGCLVGWLAARAW